MNPYVKSVRAVEDHRLILEFENGERKCFDVKPYLSRGVFSRLGNDDVFRTAHVVSGSVEWGNGLDLSYDTLYLESGMLLPEDIENPDMIPR
jgi:hypothetical protein